MTQTNNDYLSLPESLHDVYRSADNHLFHYPSGAELSAEEWQQIMQAWEACQVQDGLASYDAEPCGWCGYRVCRCHAYPEISFSLPPETEEEIAEREASMRRARQAALARMPRPARPALSPRAHVERGPFKPDTK